jgi:translation initiation factor IF-2
MTQGFECGIVVEGFNDFEVGDIIECIEQREVRRVVL